MALRQLRVNGDDILRKKAKPVKEIDAKILALLDDMWETLRDKNGVGLAAPQVGVLKRVVVVENEEDIYEMINPEIIASEGTQTCDEACLSVPGYQGDIERPMKVTVQALNRDGESYTVEVEEYPASIFCHELDHLDGVLYLDRATNVRPIEKNEDDE
ncbi:MAG: peptide deformylase [Defluviitaleaceae bacterium]|nr:peptide deformylase [Defluviitaleaceae bacterium]